MTIMIWKWRWLRFESVIINKWNELTPGCGGVVETNVVDRQGPNINILCSLLFAREEL